MNTTPKNEEARAVAQTHAGSDSTLSGKLPRQPLDDETEHALDECVSAIYRLSPTTALTVPRAAVSRAVLDMVVHLETEAAKRGGAA